MRDDQRNKINILNPVFMRPNDGLTVAPVSALKKCGIIPCGFRCMVKPGSLLVRAMRDCVIRCWTYRLKRIKRGVRMRG